jgi:molecular chaperone GrpE (heat shock protein)
MEGLVHEAKRALEGRAPKPSAPEESAHPPAEAVRAGGGLPDMLRPLLQGVQAVGRVTGEHTQILARMEKASQEATQARTDMPHLVAELKGMVEQRNQVSRQMFDALHEELKTYKDGFLLDSLHRPMIRDLITLYDDLAVIRNQAGDIVEISAGGAGSEGENTLRTTASFQARLESLTAHLEHNLDFILEVLARLEVQRLPIGSGKLDKRTQRAVAVEIAEDPDQDMDVIKSIKRGFLWKDRVVRAEEVVVKKWKEGFLVALQSAAI